MSERLTPDRLAELRRIAEAATPGPYEVVGLAGYGGPYALRMPHRSGRTWYGVEDIKRREDAEYFVAMNRNTALALLDEIEQLRAENDRLISDIKMITAPIEVGGGADAYLHHQLAQAQDQLQLVLTLLAKLLRGLEWSGWDERFRAHICPVCGGYKSKNKHFPDCDLNKALNFLRGVGRE